MGPGLGAHVGRDLPGPVVHRVRAAHGPVGADHPAVAVALIVAAVLRQQGRDVVVIHVALPPPAGLVLVVSTGGTAANTCAGHMDGQQCTKVRRDRSLPRKSAELSRAPHEYRPGIWEHQSNSP